MCSVARAAAAFRAHREHAREAKQQQGLQQAVRPHLAQGQFPLGRDDQERNPKQPHTIDREQILHSRTAGICCCVIRRYVIPQSTYGRAEGEDRHCLQQQQRKVDLVIRAEFRHASGVEELPACQQQQRIQRMPIRVHNTGPAVRLQKVCDIHVCHGIAVHGVPVVTHAEPGDHRNREQHNPQYPAQRFTTHHVSRAANARSASIPSAPTG